LLRNLANNSPWLTKPELVEITASTVALSARDQRRVSNFSMRVGLVRATDPKPASSAAAVSALAVPALSPVVTRPASAALPASKR
jgi:type IV pilus assembly protein PilN